MARLDQIGEFGPTEPDVGSGASRGLTTTARRDGDHWILNGQKKWIGNASFADLVIIWARDDEDNQVKGFVVDRGSNGMSVEDLQDKIALRVVQNGLITLDGVTVPETNRLQRATSFRDTAKVLKLTRAGVAWMAVGCGLGAYGPHSYHSLAVNRSPSGRPTVASRSCSTVRTRFAVNVRSSPPTSGTEPSSESATTGEALDAKNLRLRSPELEALDRHHVFHRLVDRLSAPVTWCDAASTSCSTPVSSCSTDRSTGSRSSGTHPRRTMMNGYVAQRRGRFYAVIYEGLDPVTGRERRRWHPAGTDRAQARATRRPARRRGAGTSRRRAVADLRRLPHRPVAAGQEAATRRQHLPRLRAQRAAPRPPRARTDRPAAAAPPPDRSALRPAPHPHRRATGPRPKTVYEIHLVIRGASPTPCAAGCSPATSPSSPAPPG